MAPVLAEILIGVGLVGGALLLFEGSRPEPGGDLLVVQAAAQGRLFRRYQRIVWGAASVRRASWRDGGYLDVRAIADLCDLGGRR